VYTSRGGFFVIFCIPEAFRGQSVIGLLMAGL
jgi:hypothetical protein